MRKHLSPEVRARLLCDRAAIDELLRPDVELPASALVLESYGAGHAWLRPEPIDPDQPIPFVVTNAGRAALQVPEDTVA